MASSSSSIGPQLENLVIRKLSDGIRLLHEPEQPDIDIIFFHGLQFEPNEYVHLTTWTCNNDPVKIWPKHWLPDARVLLASYDSSIRKTSREGTMDVFKIAENLLTEILWAIVDVLDGNTRRPIVLVGHSFGGLIIKELCLLADKNVNGSRPRDLRAKFLKNLGGIYFLATPHSGMKDLAKIKDYVQNRSPLWPYMEQLSTHAARQNADFDTLCNQERFRNWQIFAAGEGCETTIPSESSVKEMGPGQFNGILVPEGSARIGQNFITAAGDDHFSISMPEADNSTVFRHLLALIHLVKVEKKALDPTTVRAPLHVTKIPTGVDHVLNEICAKIEGKKRFIGFSGMGGVGKTTLAKLAFNKINPKFEYASFVEVGKSMGKDALKKEAWDNMVPRLEGEYVKSRWNDVRGKRLLLVFDDVEKPEQMLALEEIAESNGAQTSCFMVTTRDEGLLKVTPDWDGTFILKVQHLKSDDAKKLFLTHAFPDMIEPPIYLEEVVGDIVAGCGGLPLTIEVIGSYLKQTQDWSTWEEVLLELNAIDTKPAGVLEERVWSKLKLSYDGLKPEVQQMFLDCATIFRSKWGGASTGHEIDEFSYGEVMSAWASMYGSGRVGWQTLVDRSLVYENQREETASFAPGMHDHLRTLGGMIARESGRLMAVRTRQRSTAMSGHAHQEASSLENVVAYVIRPTLGIVEHRRDRCDKDRRCDMWKHWSPISRLQGLRYLVVRQGIFGCNRCKRERFQLPRNLVMLHLHMAEDTVLKPSSFEELVVLHVEGSLANSFDEPDPEPRRTLGKQREEVCLKGKSKRGPQRGGGYPNASICVDLGAWCLGTKTNTNTRLQVLSKLTSLYLENCSQAQALVDTIDQLQELQYLKIISFDELVTLPQAIGPLHRLQELELYASPRLDLSQSQALEIGCKNLQALPGTLGQLRLLQKLKIRCKNQQAIPDTLGQLSLLQTLEIWCENLQALPDTLGQLSLLQTLEIWCKNLHALPDTLGQLSRLQKLEIWCENLQALPDTLGQLQELQTLKIWCRNLQSLPDTIGQLRLLQELQIISNNLQALPDTLGQLWQLRTLTIQCKNLQALGQLSQVQMLRIIRCGNLQALPDTLGQLWRLQKLEIDMCENLQALPDTLGQLQLLQKLSIQECENLQSLPDTLGQLQLLQNLEIGDCENLQALPDTLGQLSQLQILQIKRCGNLHALPDTLGQLSQLQVLQIENCKNLHVLPDTLGQLQLLQNLEIEYCENLHALPDTLGELQLLQKLSIEGCKNLRALPDKLGQLWLDSSGKYVL